MKLEEDMSMSKNSLHSVLLDTSFFIRLLKEDDPLHNNAVGYYKYFLEQKYCLKISTIAISEFCVEAELTDLPLRNLQILPFLISFTICNLLQYHNRSSSMQAPWQGFLPP